MADTQTHANGIENGLEEEDLSKLRPADIDADVKEMERRKRVEMIMNSKLFREELERIIELQMKDGNGPAGLLQQISDMMGIQAGKLHTTHMFRGSNCVTPINDIRGVESMAYEKGEKNLRCKLASVFRLMDLYGWSQGIHNQITVRLNQDEEHFLVNPYGMLYNEITASSLVKVDMQGNVVEPGTTNFSVNTQNFLLHSSIHASRPDVKCIIHIHTPSVLAVSSLKCGLLPICQEALVIGEVSQHPFVSGIFEPEEKEKIIRNLGPSNKILLLNNHGALCCGETVEEAFYNVYNTVLACETQIKLIPIGVENLVLVNDETRKQVYDAAHRAPDHDGEKKGKHFRVGELEFEALIRMLDNAGFRTGYIYRHPLVKGEVPKPKNDVEVPPAVSSLGYLIEEEKLYKQGNWKKYVDGRNRLDRTKWLNSPNVYQKVEILETGTPDPKKITKWVDQNSEEWVAENSPTHSSTPVKIDSALQFVPKNTNPKEFKKVQQQIKENRLADKITSGPQSHILEGVSWEEAKKLQDANITQTGDQVILVGAASKGIIQRNFQHNALVYKTPYAKNPFDSISDKDIEEYKRLIERKERGDTDYEESQSESEAVSSRQEALRHIKSPLMSPQSGTSETEEETRAEPRVLRIETKTAPQPIQAEVVLSDAEFDTTDTRVERSQSARYPKAEKPESVTIVNSFRKSWSLKRDKDKNKDIDIPDECYSRDLESGLMLPNFNVQTEQPINSCIARIKNLKQKPVLIDSRLHSDGDIIKSASDPCNLSQVSDNKYGEDKFLTFDDCLTDSLDLDSNFNLKQRLNLRKKLIYSAKIKFLGLEKSEVKKSNKIKSSPGSRICALISEIRDKINEIVSPERIKDNKEFMSMPCFPTKCISELNFVQENVLEDYSQTDSTCKSVKEENDNCSIIDVTESSQEIGFKNITCSPVKLKSFTEIEKKNELLDNEIDISIGKEADEDEILKSQKENNGDDNSKIFDVDKDEKEKTDVVKSLLNEIVYIVDVLDDEKTYSDSDIQTYSCTQSTKTEWYYNKTILKPDNSQTVLEIREAENKEVENEGNILAKQSDTGIETDFTSEKDNVKSEFNSTLEVKALEKGNDISIVNAEAEVLENSVLNKSSETDSSLLKSSGRTSTDVDTSSAFRTETENGEKVNEIRETIKNKDQTVKLLNRLEEKSEIKKSSQQIHKPSGKLPNIPESPEFTNVDTEDAPMTSSSKDSSPAMGNDEALHMMPDEPSKKTEEPQNVETDQKSSKKKKKKNKRKSSTKITFKKELEKKDSEEPVVSEIKLTIKNSSNFKKEKYEFEIQDETNTSEELSRTASSLGESLDGYQNCEVVEGNCNCDAQQGLVTLQSEINSTIKKLQNIENFFEDEIKKSVNAVHSPESEEFVTTLNYKENEEVLSNEVSIYQLDMDKKSENSDEGIDPGMDLTEKIDIVNGSSIKKQAPFVDLMLVEEGKVQTENHDHKDLQAPTNDNESIYESELEIIKYAPDSLIITEKSDINVDKTNATNEIDTSSYIIRSDIKLRLEDLIDIESLLDEVILTSENPNGKVASTINDVFKFILNDEESPTDSFAEIEDNENVISISESVTEELDAEEAHKNDEIDNLQKQEEPEHSTEKGNSKKEKKSKKKKKAKAPINISLAMPDCKKAFNNCNKKASHPLTVAAEDEIKPNSEFCNSYINTDAVNEDFEDSPDWFSAGFPEKSSSNSFSGAISNLENNSNTINVYTCRDHSKVVSDEKSPHSLAVIEEVEEGDCAS